MDEIIEAFSEVQKKYNKTDVNYLKLELAKNTLAASEEISAFLTKGRFDSARERILKMYEDHIGIRANFAVGLFPKGGYIPNESDD